MLPRSYRDDRLTEEVKPFRNPSRNPDKIKESKINKVLYNFRGSANSNSLFY